MPEEQNRPYLERIRERVRQNQFRLSKHVAKRMDLRGRTLADICQVILTGEVIREYPQEKPYPETKPMKCLFCKEGETQPQRVTVERHNQAGEPIAVIHNFPAEVCAICGEEYYAAEDWRETEHILTRPPLRIAHVPVYELGSQHSSEA